MVAALVAERLGLDFPDRRREDLERALGSTDLVTLLSEPTTGPAWRTFIHALTVRESHFFRDAELFAALERHVLPDMLGRSLRGSAWSVRPGGETPARGGWPVIWSAGCAAGEEPYSLAILLDRLAPGRPFTLWATDVDTIALDAARRGLYTDWSLRGAPEWAIARGLRARARRHEVLPELRARVSFSPLNLVTDVYPAGLDLIVCRNVLMYFTEDARRATIDRLAAALAPGGWLALSPLDAGARDVPGLEPVDLPGVTLFRREAHLLLELA
jgi:chemotaxis protein methyltransferase CheR